MPRFYDHDTGQIVDIPTERATEALRTGRYTAPRGRTFNVVSPEGRVGALPSAELFEALQQGFRLETDAEFEIRKRAAEFGTAGQQIATVMQEALGTASLGATSAIGAELGLAADMAARREVNPGAALLGGVTGAVATGALTGGAGTAASAGRLGMLARAARMTPAGFLARGARAAELGISRMLPANAGMVSRLIPITAGSAIEGAGFGAGEIVTEAALGDLPLTAERLLMGAGIGSLVGGGAGIAFGATGQGLKGAGKVFGKIMRKAGTRGQDAFNRMYTRVTGLAPPPGMWAKASAIASGGPEDVLQRGFARGPAGREFRERMTKADDVLDRYADDITSSLDDMGDSLRRLSPEVIGVGKMRQFQQKVRQGNEFATSGVTTKQIDDVIRNIDEMIEAGPAEYAQTNLKKMRQFAQAARKKVQIVLSGRRRGRRLIDQRRQVPSRSHFNTKLVIAVDSLKRDIGKMVTRLQRVRSPTSADFNTLERSKDIYENLRQFLQREDLWGNAAIAQRGINELWTDLLSIKNYRNSFFVRFGQEGFDDLYRANDAKIRSFVQSLKGGEGLDAEFLKAHVSRTRNLIQGIDEIFVIPHHLRPEVAKAKAAAQKFEKTLNEAIKDASAINQLRELDRLPQVFGALGGAAAGFALGDTTGAVIGGVTGALLRPGQTIRQLAAIERISHRVGERVRNAVQTQINAARNIHLPAVGRRARAAGRAALGTVRPLRRGLIAAQATQEARERVDRRDRRQRVERLRSFQRSRGAVLELSARPELMGNAVATGIGPIAEVAPSTADIMAETLMTAVGFLQSKMPMPPESNELSLTPKNWTPSDAELAKWERYLTAVQDPSTIIDSFERGTLQPEQVEVLRAVYPAIYASMQQQLFEDLATLRTDLPYKQRKQLSVFFDLPVDSTFTPAFALLMQQTNEATQGGDGRGPSGGEPPPRKFDSQLPQLAQTGGQRLEAR